MLCFFRNAFHHHGTGYQQLTIPTILFHKNSGATLLRKFTTIRNVMAIFNSAPKAVQLATAQFQTLKAKDGQVQHQTHTQTHTYIHTHTCTHMYTYTHIPLHTHIHIYTHTHAYKYIACSLGNLNTLGKPKTCSNKKLLVHANKNIPPY